jgi:hypothetical protein
MPIEAQIMLAQGAFFQNGAVGLIGVGLTVRPPEPQPVAVYALIYVSREERGRHDWRLEMTYADGTPFRLKSPVQGMPQDFVFESGDDVRGLDDERLTTPLTTGPLIVLPAFPLPRGREFLWRLWVDGETRDHWAAPFRTTPPEPLPHKPPRLRSLPQRQASG